MKEYGNAKLMRAYLKDLIDITREATRNGMDSEELPKMIDAFRNNTGIDFLDRVLTIEQFLGLRFVLDHVFDDITSIKA